MANSIPVKKAYEFVSELLSTKLSEKIVYHNFTHSSEVFEAAKKLAVETDLNASDTEIVLIAALFHDTGYTVSREDHEIISSEIAAEFLTTQNYPVEKIEKVKSCILASRIPQQPKDLLEEVVCDADLSHFGKKSFFEKGDLLRVELEQTNGNTYTDFEWLKNSIDIMIGNPFRTKAAKEEYGKQRTENLLKAQKKLRKKIGEQTVDQSKLEIQKEKLELKKEKQLKPERGIETMFRITATNHLRLSGMADNKAHIMISVNTILLSIVISVLVRKLDANPHLVIPTMILLLVSLLTIVFAAIVTKPSVTTGTFTVEDIKQKKANLLFFGNFFKMNLDDFQWGMKEMMNDSEYLYGSMIKDFYFLGKVLGQKYKYLRICYNIFMYGMIIAIIAYVIAILTYPNQTVIDLN